MPFKTDRVVHRTVAAVVENQTPSREIRAGETSNLDTLAGIATGVVVVNLIDIGKLALQQKC